MRTDMESYVRLQRMYKEQARVEKVSASSSSQTFASPLGLEHSLVTVSG